MIQVYRIENKPGDSPEILFSEVCHACAGLKKQEGFHITYDITLSERTDEMNNATCQICHGDFCVDGRKVKRGELKTDIFSNC